MSLRPRDYVTTPLAVLRSEGVRAVVGRTLDHVHEARRMRSLKQLIKSDIRRVIEDNPPLVLNVAHVAPSPNRGGSQIQMLERLERERVHRPVALTYPRAGSTYLEVWTDTVSGMMRLDSGPDAAHVIAATAQLTGTQIMHLESTSGMPLDLIPELAERGVKTVLSVHDFSLFCRRPHLTDSRTGRFCEYSTDNDRCRACLARANDNDVLSQQEYRAAATRILDRTNAVVYPSEFLKNVHHRLFPKYSPSKMQLVISPATARVGNVAASTTTNSPAIGFVGGCYEHKGGALIAPIMERIRSEIPGVSAFVYGNGDPELTREVRRARGVKVRGYYRQGTLPSLLARDRITVAVLPSIWPEAYGLVVDECLASGVPVVAFDLGAVGERLRAWGTGRLVPLEQGAHGLSRAILECVESPPRVTDAVIRRIPHPEDAARRHIALYQRMISA